MHMTPRHPHFLHHHLLLVIASLSLQNLVAQEADLLQDMNCSFLLQVRVPKQTMFIYFHLQQKVTCADNIVIETAWQNIYAYS